MTYDIYQTLGQILCHVCLVFKSICGDVHTVGARARGQVDIALDTRSEGMVFDSQCWPCVDVSGKHGIPHCIGPPSHDGHLVQRSKVGSIVAGCIGAHLARGKVMSLEHALSCCLDSTQLLLPLSLHNLHV